MFFLSSLLSLSSCFVCHRVIIARQEPARTTPAQLVRTRRRERPVAPLALLASTTPTLPRHRATRALAANTKAQRGRPAVRHALA